MSQTFSNSNGAKSGFFILKARYGGQGGGAYVRKYWMG